MKWTGKTLWEIAEQQLDPHIRMLLQQEAQAMDYFGNEFAKEERLAWDAYASSPAAAESSARTFSEFADSMLEARRKRFSPPVSNA